MRQPHQGSNLVLCWLFPLSLIDFALGRVAHQWTSLFGNAIETKGVRWASSLTTAHRSSACAQVRNNRGGAGPQLLIVHTFAGLDGCVCAVVNHARKVNSIIRPCHTVDSTRATEVCGTHRVHAFISAIHLLCLGSPTFHSFPRTTPERQRYSQYHQIASRYIPPNCYYLPTNHASCQEQACARANDHMCPAHLSEQGGIRHRVVPQREGTSHHFIEDAIRALRRYDTTLQTPQK